MDERLCYIGLCWAAGLSRRTVDRLIQHFGSAAQVLEASPGVLRGSGAGIRGRGADAIGQLAEELAHVETEVAQLAENGVEVLCPFDERFPRALRDIPNPPALLTVRGALVDADCPSIAIVGTRSPSEEGRDAARTLAMAAAANGWCVVSGLALGIDTAAHEGALAAGGRTVAVLGCGIQRIYPYENRSLADSIVEHGALMSEQPLDARPTTERLTARNRLQSGLARAVVVVETGPTGGSHVTASHARRQGRPVFAVAWPGGDRRAQGTAALLARGAYPADVSGDLGALLAAIQQLEAQQTARSDQQARLL